MTAIQWIRNALLFLACVSFGLAAFGTESIAHVRLVPAGLMLWATSVMVKVSNAKGGVFF